MNKHGGASEQISGRKLAANQENAKKSTGPIDTTSTRFNAVKHGLLSKGVTELDQPHQFPALLGRIKKELQPVGVLEEECVDHIAVLMIQIRRGRLLEAQAFTAHLNPAKTISHPGKFDDFDPDVFGRTEVLDLGLPAQVSMEIVDQINRTIARYQSAAERMFFRWLNQLERLQRARRGETLPPPVALDVAVHGDVEEMASFGKTANR